MDIYIKMQIIVEIIVEIMLKIMVEITSPSITANSTTINNRSMAMAMAITAINIQITNISGCPRKVSPRTIS